MSAFATSGCKLKKQNSVRKMNKFSDIGRGEGEK